MLSFDPALVKAFILGIVSACSLPLGTLTSVIWKPRDRELAFLMAFGGGALLAALTIDLVASALDKGHFIYLAAGSIGGGLLFIGLNELINPADRGGEGFSTQQPDCRLPRRAAWDPGRGGPKLD